MVSVCMVTFMAEKIIKKEQISNDLLPFSYYFTFLFLLIQNVSEDTIKNGGKSASFTVTMTDPQENGDFRIYYPEKVFLSTTLLADLLNNQDGTFSSLASDLDYADCLSSLSGYQLPSSIVLDNCVSILKVKIKDSATGDDITSSVTKLVVSNFANTHTITPSSPLSTIYVAVWPVICEWTFTAYVGTDVYTKTTPDYTLPDSGKVYPINVTVVKQ